MQNWDTRIKNLKTDIEIARQKYVVPFIKAETKVPPVSKEVNQNPIPTEPSLDNNVQPGSEKLYENKDPLSSLDLINKSNEVSSGTKVGLTEEITNKIDDQLDTVASADAAPTVDVEEAVASADAAPTVDVEEAVASADAAPTVDVEEAVASADAAPTVDVEEAVASADAAPTVDVEEAVASSDTKPTVDVNEAVASEDAAPTSEKVEEPPTVQDGLEGEQKKSELELLEERDENDLSEEEEDRMYELRRLRAQKKMNNEVREAEQEELEKADEEIAHLKTLLKPKPKKLPKGYVA